MLSLTANNRELTKNAKYSYLSNNYNSGVSALVVKNSNCAVANDYALLGEFGSQQSEIIKIETVTSGTHTLNFPATSTKFAHSQDTKVSIIRYNQVKYYQTGTEDVQANRINTIYQDSTNVSGYGWFCFFNSTTSKITSNSNAIPYGGFASSSVKEIFDAFFSILNNKEMKLISQNEAFRHLSEGYAKAQNELNLINQAYKVKSEWTVTTANGTQEYDLATDFSNLISITNSDGEAVDFINLANVFENDENESYSNGNVKYFLRGKKIGFSPVPTGVDIYSIYYQAKAPVLTNYYDSIDLPDNQYYFLIDWMLYRVAPKLGRTDAKLHYDNFMAGINSMKISANKQNSSLDSWNISDGSNV
jgi:hypothetical protein